MLLLTPVLLPVFCHVFKTAKSYAQSGCTPPATRRPRRSGSTKILAICRAEGAKKKKPHAARGRNCMLTCMIYGVADVLFFAAISSRGMPFAPLPAMRAFHAAVSAAQHTLMPCCHEVLYTLRAASPCQPSREPSRAAR